MKALGCMLMFVVALVLFVLVVGWRLLSTLFGFKGRPFTMFRTMKNFHEDVKNMQEQMKQQTQSQSQSDRTTRRDSRYYDETSQQRTDTTSPGARKVIPDDEGEYVSYEEVRDKN